MTEPVNFTTSIAIEVHEDGTISRRAHDDTIRVPISVIIASYLDARQAARQLRRLANELEAGR